MNKRTRLIVSLLFAVIIIFAAAITRFYVNVPDNMQSDSNQTEIVRTVETDSSGNIIFSDGKGSFGIADSVRITANPEWQELKFSGDGRCIASKKIGGELLYGCIDYEGNAVTPFIYSDITRYTINNLVIYCAESSADNSFVLYNMDFMPLFRRSWDSCSFNGNEAVFSDDCGIYTFYADADGLLFKSAYVSGEVMDCPYNLNIYSRVLLSKLSPYMIEKMTAGAEKYLEYAYTFNDELLSEITSGNRSSFVPAFKNDNNIISRKLLGISDMHIYSVSSDDGIPHYDVSINADTEIIYYDESGTEKTLYDNYRLAVRFSGSSESDIHAVSGRFELDSPVYPKPEPPVENQEQDIAMGD
ncbi:MAG: hypothetical protein K2J47_06695 [Ruminococcus sp.]|nr:hypothetical protein [Ruminococcus sp.]